MAGERVIVHVDMDAFFASIEQRDNPEYRGRPVIVGADPRGGRGRGVVSTCSYEARDYGVRSAQPISEAFRRCPHGIFLPVRMHLYQEVGGEVLRVLEEFAPDIEPISIDEAFLDVSGSLHLFGTKRQLAEQIQRRIEQQTGLTASLGVAPNKMVAKIASDMEKPRGIVIVEPQDVEAFLRPLPVDRLWGVGEKTRKLLEELGIRTIGELADFDRDRLSQRLGKPGADLWELAHGRDRRPVEAGAEAGSVSSESTFERDVQDPKRIATTLMQLCESVAHRLREAGTGGRTVTTKVRFEDFTTLTRARTVESPLDSAPRIYELACQNLERVAMEGRKIRLVGVAVSGLESGGARQTSLFGRAQDGRDVAEKERLLSEAIDRIKKRFGEGAIRRGASLRRPNDREVRHHG